MSGTVDYTKRPYSFYVTETHDGFMQARRPALAVSRAQFAPWDEPQQPGHAKLILQNISDKVHKTGFDSLVHAQEKIHDPQLGVMCSHIFYYNPENRPMK